MVFDVNVINQILRSEDFRVSWSKDDVVALEERLRIELPGISSVADFMPVAHEGAAHASLRKAMALTINEAQESALSVFGEYTDRRIAEVFDCGEPFDFIQDVLAPASSKLMAQLSGICLAPLNGELAPPQMLDRLLNVKRRKLIDKQICELLAAALENAPRGKAGIQVAIAILGSDSLLGSIAESFINEISSNPGKLLSEIVWSEKLTSSAVPYIERKTVRSTTVDGKVIGEGHRIRLYLDVFKFRSEDQQDAYFGAGKHACLGRLISQRAWRILSSCLKEITKRIEIQDIEYRQTDFMFNFPSSIKVAIHAK